MYRTLLCQFVVAVMMYLRCNTRHLIAVRLQCTSGSGFVHQRRRLQSIQCVATPAAAAAGKEPLESRVLSSLLNVGSVPYSAYVPEPQTLLHRLHPVVKQAWLWVLLVLVAGRSNVAARVAVAAGVAAVTVATLPRRLWVPQLRRMLWICGFVLLATALSADGVPPPLQTRAPDAALQGLPPPPAADGGYRYVLLNLGIFTVTRRAVKLAVAAASVTFVALQSASLALTTTPPEQLALALGSVLRPFKLIGLPAEDVTMTLLLSLRFLSLVFDETRNLCLGLAARAVDWRRMGRGQSVAIGVALFGRLFGNLLQRCDAITTAMQARGFVGSAQHTVYVQERRQGSWALDAAAVAALVLVAVLVKKL